MTEIVGLCAISIVCTGAVLTRLSRATHPRWSLGEWEHSDVWWQQGKCSDCHRVSDKNEVLALGIATEKPTSHRQPSWLLVHGRADVSSESRCYVCHSRSTCESCHGHAPATHTKEFLQPSGEGLEANRHILLGRLRPSSCLVCHRSFVSTCSTCHAPSELHDWQDRGLADLRSWSELLRSPQKLHSTASELD